MTIIRTLCSRCAMGCGVRATTHDARRLIVEGDRIHPLNLGWLCPAGMALPSKANLDGRLLHAIVAGRKVARDRAINHSARRLAEIRERHGPDSIALHVAGDLSTEDYYVANKWLKGFVGTANIAVPWKDRSAKAQIAAFGEDVIPASFEDIDCADLIVIVGAELLGRYPMLERRVATASEDRATRVVIIDPDPAALAIPADLHCVPRAGTIHRLLGGLLFHAHEKGLANACPAPPGYWEALGPGHDIWSVARDTGVPIASIRQLYDLFTATSHMVTLLDPDVSTSPVDSHAIGAIFALHLAAGRIGKLGAAPFALPGSVNAMGARETGCTAWSLAAHNDFSADARDSVTRFWSAPHLAMRAGPSADALQAALVDGGIKALFVLGGSIRDAIPAYASGAARPFTIFAGDMIDHYETDQIDVALPMAHLLERDGAVTSADRLIARQRAVFPLPGEAKPGWWIITQIARGMGWNDAFPYERPADIYREHARLSAYHNDGRRIFSLRRHAPMSNPAYNELTPWRWGGLPFHQGRFSTNDGAPRLPRFWD